MSPFSVESDFDIYNCIHGLYKTVRNNYPDILDQTSFVLLFEMYEIGLLVNLFIMLLNII